LNFLNTYSTDKKFNFLSTCPHLFWLENGILLLFIYRFNPHPTINRVLLITSSILFELEISVKFQWSSRCLMSSSHEMRNPYLLIYLVCLHTICHVPKSSWKAMFLKVLSRIQVCSIWICLRLTKLIVRPVIAKSKSKSTLHD